MTLRKLFLLAASAAWCGLPPHALGQHEPTIRSHPQFNFRLIGFSSGYQHVSFLSPIYYPTLGLSSLRGRLDYRVGWQRAFAQRLNLALGVEQNQSMVTSVDTDHFFSLSRRLPLPGAFEPAAPTTLAVGLGYWLDLDFVVKPDNQNNPAYYNFNNMLCLTLYARHRMGWLTISNELFLPLVGLYSASEFASSYPLFLQHPDASLADAFRLGSFGLNTQVVNRLNLDVRYTLLGRTRTLRIQYEFMGQRFELNHNLKHMAFHTLRLGFLINRKEVWYVHP